MIRNFRQYYPLAILIIATTLVFGSVCGHEFIAYDDEINIYANRYVINFSLSNLLHFWGGLYQNLYIPLTYDIWLLLAKVATVLPHSSADILNPLPFHALNLVLHLGCALLVFSILRLLVEDEWCSLAGALLFALHPIQVEAVSWATGLKDVLSAMLGLFAVWQYVLYARSTYDQKKRISHYLFAGFAYIGAILSKPSSLSLPLSIMLVGYFLLERSPKKLVHEMAPWLLVSFPFIIITKLAQPAAGISFSPNLWQRFLIAGDVWTFYFTKLLWPWQMGPDYGRTPELVLEHGLMFWLSGVFPYLILILLLFYGNRFVRATIGFTLAMLLPVSGFVSFDFQEYSTVADRYFYLAMLGPALLFGKLLGHRLVRRWVGSGIAFVIVLLGGLSLVQVGHWQNGVSFYSNALQVNPQSWLSANNLGVIYLDRNDLPEAAKFFEQAIALKPDYAIALNNLGTIRGRQGNFDSAQILFARALEIKPSYADAAANLGDISLRHGDVVRAGEYYRRALEIKPDFAEVHAALGEIASRSKHVEEALVQYQLALDYGPPSAKLLNNLGLIYKELGRVGEASECYRRALSFTPDSAEVHNNLGLIYYEAGDYSNAIVQFEIAGRLRPDQPQPFCNLGKAFLESGQTGPAKDAFMKSLTIDLGYAPALSGLSRLYRSVGREDLAADYANKARALGFSGETHP